MGFITLAIILPPGNTKDYQKLSLASLTSLSPLWPRPDFSQLEPSVVLIQSLFPQAKGIGLVRP